ncbi:AAA family ATPase [Oscillochloris sp. ZM17-4]|uniref:AAA family ATPase n=1 Tax=Oscillochloris sp. ZM17-4 TaxID=2866714 RepID=UPI00351D2C07
MPPTRGLTLGKFAPLHRGHQLLIDTALAEVDELVIIIYDCPETTPIPLSVRAAWLRDLYPQARVVEAWDGPLEIGDTPDIRRMHEQYVIARLRIGRVTHFYSSEFYGAHMSRALGAVDRRVDPARAAVPVSGTQVRADPYAWRASVHPRVYRDLVTNVVLLGAPSTGKTTLAARLAEVYATVWMPEYGREYWEQHQVDRRLTLGQLADLADGHLAREEALLAQANRYLFTDTNAITTAMFSLAYHRAVAPRLAELATQAQSRYDLVIVCDSDIPYADTWDRSGDADRQVFQKQILADLRTRKLPFLLVSGDLEARVRQVGALLARHRTYANLFETLATG